MQDVDLMEHVSVDPEICHGKPCIKGTRVLVETILTSLDDGMTTDEIQGHYPSLSSESIRALAHYARKEKAVAVEISGSEPDFQ